MVQTPSRGPASGESTYEQMKAECARLKAKCGMLLARAEKAESKLTKAESKLTTISQINSNQGMHESQRILSIHFALEDFIYEGKELNFSREDVHRVTGVGRTTISNYVTAMHEAGGIEVTSETKTYDDGNIRTNSILTFKPEQFVTANLKLTPSAIKQQQDSKKANKRHEEKLVSTMLQCTECGSTDMYVALVAMCNTCGHRGELGNTTPDMTIAVKAEDVRILVTDEEVEEESQSEPEPQPTTTPAAATTTTQEQTPGPIMVPDDSFMDDIPFSDDIPYDETSEPEPIPYTDKNGNTGFIF